MAARPKPEVGLPKRKPDRRVDPVSAYAYDVVSGKIVACRYVRLACQRHFNDLAYGAARGLSFSPDFARFVIGFFAIYLRHSKGEWGGQPLILEPWQEFTLGSIYAWFRKDGTRRFRTAYQEVARKNGKSSLASGVGIFGLVADHEPGAEVYTAAPLALSTEIPTQNGWVTMGDIKVGDEVFDDQGRACNVTYVSPVLHDRPCWELEFSNGEKVICDEQHRWLCDAREIRGAAQGSKRTPVLRCESGRKAIFSLHNRKHYVCRWDDPEREAKFAIALAAALADDPLRNSRLGVRTTAVIIRDLRTKGGNPNFRLPIGRILDYRGGDALPMQPYTLGVWLGDGRANRGAIVGHPSDAEIVDEIERDGYAISDHGGNDGLRHYTVLGLRTQLRETGLLDNKHIPDVYQRAAYADRLALLQALMDTDGTATTTGECRFTNRSWRLASGVQELARGLGLRTVVRATDVLGTPHYMVSFKVSANDLPAFRLTRKRQRQPRVTDEKTRWLQVVGARPVASEPVRCISVDAPSHLYLATRSLVATHNTKKDQARIIFDEAVRMVKASPDLLRKVGVFKANLSVDATASKFEPLSADEKTLDGLNPHLVLIDELHKHKSRAVLDVLDTALGARRQPLLWMITTSGDDSPETVYAAENAYAMQVLEATAVDDSYFAMIYTLDKEDEWFDPKVWIKANPNLNVSVKLDDLRRQALKAKHSPNALAAFKRLRLNVRTSDATRAINMDVWRQNNTGTRDPASLVGRAFYGGLDLSSKIDLSAFVKLFPPIEDETRWIVQCRFWMPGDTIEEKADRDRVQYQRWIDEGLIEPTAGNIIDHNEIQAAVLEDCRQYEALSIAYDPWNAAQLAVNLHAGGAPMQEFIQGLRSYTAPTKQLEAMLLAQKLDHGGNDVLTWMAGNLHVMTDKNLNLMPTKRKSTGRIDGIVSLIMAIGRSMVEAPRSYLETSDPLSF